MSDTAILFVKPKAISAKDKKSCLVAGIVVIEIDDPANAKFIRAGSEIEGAALLNAAATAINGSSYAEGAFGRAVCAAIDAAFSART